MNNSIYEEYMRTVLGYQLMNNYNMYDDWEMPGENFEDCYPEIYRIVYPMIQKACMENTRPLTRDLIDSMTDEIYYSIEDKEMVQNREKTEKSTKSTDTSENRQTSFRNSTLRDIVRILLLRELLGRPSFPGGRPPRPRPPMRPPMGPPPRPQPRPGMGFNRQGLYDELYEY